MAFRKRFQLSDESLNDYGTWLVTAGCFDTDFRNNAPLFFNHQTYNMPLGHVENLTIENGKYYGDIVIDGVSDDEKEAIRKINNGDLKGVSMGVDILELSTDPMYLKPGQALPTVIRWAPYELSLTPLPANKNSLVLRRNGRTLELNEKTKPEELKLFLQPSNEAIISKTEKDMKSIALKLGLPETATESEILQAIVNLQLSSANAEAMRTHIEAAAGELLETEQAKTLFAELSKTNFKQALSFLELNKKPVAASTETKVIKDVKLSSILKKVKEEESGNDDDTKSFDYLQRHNPAELARIRKEEPDKYMQLAKGYQSGIRYKGK
jgi:hypothetical protein